MSVSKEFPRYKYRKMVWALKIKEIDLVDSKIYIIPEDEGYPKITVSFEYWHKHKPTVGGYYVVYKDGYESFSPAEAFESGYTKVLEEDRYNFNVAEIAEACHEINRIYCRSINDFSQLRWNDLPPMLKISVINGVEFYLSQPFAATPQQSHQNWLEHKEKTGWTYGEVKDLNKKTHPCMVPYDQLPKEQRYKDELFLNTIKMMINRK